MGEIHVSAVAMRDANGQVLTVRKRGTKKLMLPGGKPEAGEPPERTALREFAEELGVELDPQQLRFLGKFEAAAANERGFTVVAHVYEHPFVAGTRAHAEIAQLEWVDPALTREDMAPLNTEQIFPLLLAAGSHDGTLPISNR